MKHLFFVRHENYELDSKGYRYHLSLQEKSEMEKLSELMKHFACPNFYILSSPESVAKESARVLAIKLNLDNVEEYLDLWSGGLAPRGENLF